MERIRFATIWLGGCSGCHMSFLDLDEFLFDLAEKAELVYSPIADIKDYPENVDVCLVEGAVANEENLHLIKKVRERTKILVSFGDCAINGNVTAMRNPLGKPENILQEIYIKNVDANPQIPEMMNIVPKLLDSVKPVHEVVKVDAFLPGCPPPAERIKLMLLKILEGAEPVLSGKDLKNG